MTTSKSPWIAAACFAGAISVAVLLAPPATAGPVYLQLVINPSTTAGSGVSSIPRQDSFGNFSVTSNKSGVGSFHLYALDDTIGSFGLASFSVALGGNVSNFMNRSPLAFFDTFDDAFESVPNGSGNAGFSDTLLRTGSFSPANPIQGSQVAGSAFRIAGLGQTASNFNNTPNLPVVPPFGSRQWSSVVSGQWGNYATAPSTINGKKWLLLGEGNYTGQAPRIDLAASTASYYSSADLNSQGLATLAGFPACDSSCAPQPIGGTFFADVTAPRTVTTNVQSINPASSWSDFHFVSYTPGPGESSTGPALPATFDAATQMFSWNSAGSAVGAYVWGVTATNSYGSNQGLLTVKVFSVPEPATLSLFALAALVVGVSRRRQPY